MQVKELFNEVDVELTSVLHKHKWSLNKLSTEALRGVVYELLASIGVDTRYSCFHNDPLKHLRSKRCELIYERQGNS